MVEIRMEGHWVTLFFFFTRTVHTVVLLGHGWR